jgi:hypothetical protein
MCAGGLLAGDEEDTMSRRMEETVYTIDQLRLEVEDNQLGIGITEEDGPCNELIAVLLTSPEDHTEWIAICRLAPATLEPSIYPAIACWFTKSVRGRPYNEQHYMFLPLADLPCTDMSRPSKQNLKCPE